MTLKLVDHYTIQPIGHVEDIPVKIERIYISADFMVVDIEEDHDCPMILERPFIATAGAIVDVKNGRIVFQVSDEMVGFELENVMKASVSLLPLSLFKKMGIRELKLTEMTLKLVDHYTIQPIGHVEDIPVKIERIYISADFMVVDIEEDHDCPMILERPFIATAGAIVDVKNGRIVFQVSDEMVGFELENVMKGSALYSCCMIKDHDVKERFLA
ncbi:hypothetical protein MTR_1g050895 [Medicago truncatula]|uniref:Uncharacterized protein n=1 Tax=Medicago truncatula TaxID=3880 RepID=A0A072VHF5_MEDTR|nr:hypothetical protein MTR_1g050875 [Medicago truncatula]KEH41439.1 hypothetical protein MTR_1g050885 [Medicago truncatula]KEH41440.1 hypothetical protein MTR_1g050895 [Medicago truncatula]